MPTQNRTLAEIIADRAAVSAQVNRDHIATLFREHRESLVVALAYRLHADDHQPGTEIEDRPSWSDSLKEAGDEIDAAVHVLTDIVLAWRDEPAKDGAATTLGATTNAATAGRVDAAAAAMFGEHVGQEAAAPRDHVDEPASIEHVGQEAAEVHK